MLIDIIHRIFLPVSSSYTPMMPEVGALISNDVTFLMDDIMRDPVSYMSPDFFLSHPYRPSQDNQPNPATSGNTAAAEDVGSTATTPGCADPDDALGMTLFGPTGHYQLPVNTKVVYPLSTAGGSTPTSATKQHFTTPEEQSPNIINSDSTKEVEEAARIMTLSTADLTTGNPDLMALDESAKRKDPDVNFGPPSKKEKLKDVDIDDDTASARVLSRGSSWDQPGTGSSATDAEMIISLRHQLSRERDEHRDEVNKIRAQCQQQLADKDQLIIKEKNFTEFLTTTQETTYKRQIQMMTTAHQVSITVLEKALDEARQGQTLSPLPSPGDQTPKLVAELAEMQSIADSKDVVITSLREEIEQLQAGKKELLLQATEHMDKVSCLNTKIADKKAQLDSTARELRLRLRELEDANEEIASLQAQVDGFKKESENQDEQKQKIKTHLDTLMKRITELQGDNDNLLAAKNELQKLKRDPGDDKNFEETILLHKNKLLEAEDKVNSSETQKTLLEKTNSVLSFQIVELKTDITDLETQIETISTKLTHEVQEKMALLESHRKEKKALRQSYEEKHADEVQVAFERESFLKQQEISVDPHADGKGSTDSDDSSPMNQSLPEDGEASEDTTQEQKMECESPAEQSSRKTFPEYNKDLKFSSKYKQTNVSEKSTEKNITAEKEKESTSSKDSDKMNDEAGSENMQEKEKNGDDGWTYQSRRKKGKSADARSFKSPSPRREKERRDSHRSRDSRSRSGVSSERTPKKDTMEIEDATRHLEEIRKKVITCQQTIDEKMGDFKDALRSTRVSEEEKFERMERCLTKCLKSENFGDMKAFLKGQDFTRKTFRLPKGALPDLREDSPEWELMTSWPPGQQRKESALIHFNHTIVAFRPYCEPLYRMFTTLLAAGDEDKDVTNILFTRSYDRGQRERSLEMKKFDLLLVLSVAKTYFALRDGKEVLGIRKEKLRCLSRPYTADWAEELSTMLDGDVNQSKQEILMPLYVDTVKCSAAITEFYRELARIKKRVAGKPAAFNPW